MPVAAPLALLAANALAADPCAIGTHAVRYSSDCELCLNDEDRSTGVARYKLRDVAYELSFASGRVVHMQRQVEGEGAERQIADLGTGAWETTEVCRVTIEVPGPSRAGLRWLDEHGNTLMIEQLWGLGQRNMRNLFANPDGTYDVVGARRFAAPGAHMNDHWTDGFHHRRTLGAWRVTGEDGAVETGQWAKGEPVGVWTVVASDGTLRERGTYVRGYPDGAWTCGAEDGTQTRGKFSLGRKTGRWVTRDATGRVISAVTYIRKEEDTFRGRHWRGGFMSGGEIRSPCAVVAEVELVGTPSDAVPAGMVEFVVVDDAGLLFPGVRVRIVALGIDGKTDGEGRIVLGPLPAGTYEVTVERYGINKVRGRLVVTTGGVSVGLEVSFSGAI